MTDHAPSSGQQSSSFAHGRFKSYKASEVPKALKRLWCYLKKSTSVYLCSFHFYQLLCALEDYKHKIPTRNLKSLKKNGAIYPMKLAKTHLQYKIFYLAFESLFGAFQMILSLIDVFSTIMKIFLPKLPLPSILLKQTIMHPLSAFLWIKTLLVHIPKFVMHLTYMNRLKKIIYSFQMEIKGKEEREELREFLRKMIKYNSDALKALPKEEKELQLLLENDPLYILSILHQDIDKQFLQDSFQLVIASVGLTQAIFLLFSPVSAVAITIFYWILIVMQYVVEFSINKIMKERMIA